MLDWLLAADTELFRFINDTLANPVTDAVMPLITNDWFLRIAYGVVLVLLLALGRRRFIWVVLLSGLVVLITDQSSAGLLKALIERVRPCRALEDVRLLVHCGSGYSFPSSHAANLFGQAAFFGLLYEKCRWYSVTFAFLVGISRIFVGVHYPLDMLAGATLGLVEGGLVAAGFLYLREKYANRPETSVNSLNVRDDTDSMT